MKHTLLATTALVALTGAASAASFTVSGSARIGLVTTEGAAAVAASTTYGPLSQAMLDTAKTVSNVTLGGATLTTMVASDYTSAVAAINVRLNAITKLYVTDADDSDVDTTAEVAALNHEVANLNAVLAALAPTVVKKTAKVSDTTVGANRMRVKFAGSGETDGGLAYGASFKAHESAGASSGTLGSQYISGAFGKISMGDLNGADEQMVGDVAGVGFSGAGSHELTSYQSNAHNLAYSISMAGVSFAASTDLARGADSTKTGSNSAMGLKWSGDMGGASVSIGVGTSKIGDEAQDSMSASVSMGGLTIKAVSSTNDNGGVDASTEAKGTTALVYSRGLDENAQPDTDQTSLSLSYAMDSLTVSAYTRTVSTSGTTDIDYSGVGFAYDLGGASLKAGFVDADNISVMDFGVTFSF